MQALEGIGDSAFAEVGLSGNRRVGGIQPPCCVVEEIEQEDMQDLQAAGADGAAMFAGFVRLPVKVPRAVPELESHLLRHWGELDWFCGALSPDRKFSIGLLRHNRQARQDPLGECRHRCASSVEPRRPWGGQQDAVPHKQVGLAFLPEIHKIGGVSANHCVSPTKGPAAPLTGRRWHVYGSTMQSLLGICRRWCGRLLACHISPSQVETDCRSALYAVSDTRPVP